MFISHDKHQLMHEIGPNEFMISPQRRTAMGINGNDETMFWFGLSIASHKWICSALNQFTMGFDASCWFWYGISNQERTTINWKGCKLVGDVSIIISRSLSTRICEQRMGKFFFQFSLCVVVLNCNNSILFSARKIPYDMRKTNLLGGWIVMRVLLNLFAVLNA